ncbi:hypothetical protein Tco_1548488 [Tanacetum coccineum]
MPTEMELTLEQTQQGVSYEVSVDPHGFEGYLIKMVVEVPDPLTPRSIHLLIHDRQTNDFIKAQRSHSRKVLSMFVQKSSNPHLAKFQDGEEIVLGYDLKSSRSQCQYNKEQASIQKSLITYNIPLKECQKDELKTKDKALKKSLRDFHKTHPSGSGTVTKTAPSAAKIKPSITNEGTDVKSEAESWGKDKDDSNNEHDSRSEGSDQERDSGDDKAQSDNEKGLDSEHETNENESGSKSNKKKIKNKLKMMKRKRMTNLLKPHPTLLMMKKKPMFKIKLKFDDDKNVRLNEPVDTDKGFIQKEGTDAEMINVQQGIENPKISQVIEDAHVILSTVLQKTEVPVTSSSQSSDLASKFLNFLDIPHTNVEIVSLMDVHVHHEILPKEVSNFAPSVIQSMVTESLEHAVLAKESSQPKSTYEVASSLIEFELKKIIIDKMDESQSYLTGPEHRECYYGLIKYYDLDKSLFSTYDKKRKTNKDAEPTKGLKAKESHSGLSKGTKSQSKSSGKSVQSEEPEFEVADSNMPQDQEENPGPTFKILKGTRSNYAELEYDFEECYKALLEKLDWKNPEGVDYFFNNDLKYLQGGISTMTYTTSITKTKAAQYDLQGIEDMTFYGYARGLESIHDVYSTKRILAVTRVKVTRKHGYGYLKEMEVRRADNDLYTFKEGDFPRLCINDIEDVLLLIVKNKLTNLSGDNVSNFETTRPELRNKDPYTPYQDPQGFIYVDNKGRNRLMRSDELYKFSDRTLTGLRTSLDDIVKNIRMEYLPQRRWSTLEKKRANIMIKAIDNQLKERRMMKSLKKFIGGRHYETDLRLLQRTI